MEKLFLAFAGEKKQKCCCTARSMAANWRSSEALLNVVGVGILHLVCVEVLGDGSFVLLSIVGLAAIALPSLLVASISAGSVGRRSGQYQARASVSHCWASSREARLAPVGFPDRTSILVASLPQTFFCTKRLAACGFPSAANFLIPALFQAG